MAFERPGLDSVLGSVLLSVEERRERIGNLSSVPVTYFCVKRAPLVLKGLRREYVK